MVVPQGIPLRQYRQLGRRIYANHIHHAVDKALVQCTAEFDHGLRHRLHSQHARTLAKPYKGGSFDSSLPMVGDKDVTGHFRQSKAAKKGRYQYALAVGESSVLSLVKILNKAVSTASQRWGEENALSERPTFEIQPTAVTGLNQRKGVLFRLDTELFGGFGARNVAGIEGKDKWCVTHANDSRIGWEGLHCMRHQNILELIRPALRPWKRRLRQKTKKARKMNRKRDLVKALSRIKSQGFVNYYSVPHHRAEFPAAMTAGCALGGDYRAAVEAYLMRSSTAGHVSKGCYHAYRGGNTDIADYHALLMASPNSNLYFPRTYSIYEQLLQPDASRENYRTAYRFIPKEIRALPLLAIREHIFNYMASARIALYGTLAVAGDLVVLPDGAGVRHITPEEAAEGVFSAYDVVLPVVTLPYADGSVVFPEHEVGEGLVEEVMSDFGVSLSEMNSDQDHYEEWEEVIPAGLNLERYRHILVKPLDLKWRFVDNDVVEGDRGDVHFLETLPNIDIGTPLHLPPETPAQKIVITADLPNTTHMSSLMREVFMSSTLRGIPNAWRIAPFRPGAMITPDMGEEMGAGHA